MNCSCRTAALRIFVRSVAHVQIRSTLAAGRLSQSTPLARSLRCLRAFDKSSSAILGSSSRSFHATCLSRSAAEVVDAAAQRSNDLIGDAPIPKAATKRRARSKTNTPAKASTSKSARSAKKPKPKRTVEEVQKPSLHEKIIEEKEDEEGFKAREAWKVQKAALKKKFPDGWEPMKKLSPDALAGIRAIHQQFPDEYTTPVLAEKFKMSPEAIRRILRSKWTPNPEEEIDRQNRWVNRGKKVWARWAEEGKKPPVRWRKEGIVRDPSWNMPKKVKEEIKTMVRAKKRIFKFGKRSKAGMAAAAEAKAQEELETQVVMSPETFLSKMAEAPKTGKKAAPVPSKSEVE
ncbi:hypothetical protein QBC34DRAFT_391098 [Podospora aff. communis PSN243]|uniref:Required for respiratory growth protein 9, mitochondrial n=1 Tax=Podospora aff. communis PSN243 TaxID=3040156 RepID=A0AAV9H2S8_9PEZI|nr:hypothetical protein QBC34DRAFT_391098 [Podospora aff. communis PSN243]